MKLSRTAAVAAVVALAAASTAGAVDETKPPVACYGLAFADKKGDHASTAPGAQPGPRDNLDLLGGFYKYDPAKAAEATTFNMQISNLSKEIPAGATAISWYIGYGNATGDYWLRALTDFSGIVSYETGHFEVVGPQTQSVRDGSTQGAFFEGADGLIQIVYPADGPGKPGTALKNATVTAYEARQALPGAAPTPAKGGLLYKVDDATTKGGHTVGSACPASQPAAPAPGTGTGGPLTQPLNSGGGPLPVKVLTKKVKRAKKITLKLRSSEALTKVAAQLVKGKKVVAKGSLAKLNGNGKLKLKAKKLKKGTYRLDLAGTDGSGARRFAAAKLKVG